MPRPVLTAPIRVVRRSCFAAGTPVWTELGPQPIESLTAGDRVLSQDPESGELAFQLVTARTMRPPVDTINITIGEEIICSTKGHPFWVNSHGWRMAKLLEVGDQLHAIGGGLDVVSTKPSSQQEAHNLVVAGTGTYFVGQQGILVHDNTYRKPTRAAIPGYAAVQ